MRIHSRRRQLHGRAVSSCGRGQRDVLRIPGTQDRRVQTVLSSARGRETLHGAGTTRTGDPRAAKLDGSDDQRLGTRIRVVGLHSDGGADEGASSLALLSYSEQELPARFHVEKASPSYSLVIYAVFVLIDLAIVSTHVPTNRQSNNPP